MGLIKYLLINPCLISRIICEDVTQEDLSCPTIIDKKIKIINCSKVNPSSDPEIGIVDMLFDSKIKDQI